MIEYLVKSGICLTVLLAVYHLFLEKEKMHRFNRFFLLFSLAFGLIIPFIEIASSPLQPIEFSRVQETATQPVLSSESVDIDLQVPSDTTPTGNPLPIILIVYGLVTCLLFSRFIVNIVQIASKVLSNSRIKSEHGTIILVKEKAIPHSFLNYIFLNEDAYLEKDIQEQIIAHELTHVRQKHSIDILLAELLKIIFWFNPVFILYKKAIQLNHEYLADETVIASYKNISAYQNLLIQAAGLKTVKLASNFNYSLTKKRLEMMKKHTSRSKAMLKEIALIPLVVVMVFLFSNQIIAQSQPLANKSQTVQQSGISKEEFYKGATIFRDGETNRKKYEVMTAAEKKSLPSPPFPTKELMNIWKDSKKYAVSIDYKRLQNKDLEKYQPGRFVFYQSMKADKGPLVLIHLFTREYMQVFLKGKSKNIGIYDGKLMLPPPPPPPARVAAYPARPKEVKIVEQTGPIHQAVVQVVPEFPGGIAGWSKFMRGYTYPAMARENNIQGTLYMTFVVEKDGTLSEIKVLRDLEFGTGEEAVRLLKTSPKWNPGVQNGRPVRVIYTQPIKLSLAK